MFVTEAQDGDRLASGQRRRRAKQIHVVKDLSAVEPWERPTRTQGFPPAPVSSGGGGGGGGSC